MWKCVWASVFLLAAQVAANASYACHVNKIDGPHAIVVVYFRNIDTTGLSTVKATRLYVDEKMCILKSYHYFVIDFGPGVHTLRGDQKDGGTQQEFTADKVYYYTLSPHSLNGFLVHMDLRPVEHDAAVFDS